VRPIIGAEFGIEQAGAAHELLESGEVSGKVLLRVAD
jgi:NADPH:quinone reductase-like Zn-dependent oxidoreductase